MVKIYLYSTNNIEKHFDLPKNIETHFKSYTDTQKNISASNYQKLSIKLSQLNLNINNLYFSKNGKPLLDELYLSLSHSDSYYGFAISLKQDIGLDIENCERFESDKLAKTILNEDEYKEFSLTKDKSYFLTSKWCEKEALGKMIGTGIDKDILKSTATHKKTFKITNNIVAIVSDKPIEYAELYLDDKKWEN